MTSFSLLVCYLIDDINLLPIDNPSCWYITLYRCLFKRLFIKLFTFIKLSTLLNFLPNNS